MTPTPSTAAWTADSVVVTERRGTTGTSTVRSEPAGLEQVVERTAYDPKETAGIYEFYASSFGNP